MRKNLLQWQWSDYASKHQSRSNLLLHIFAVPLFQIGTIGLFYAAFVRSATTAGIAVGCMVVSLIIQGRGHKSEYEQPAPFSGALDFPTRFFAEQWVTFPRFVLSGGWYCNFKANRENRKEMNHEGHKEH